jgi:DNA-binding transcriptional regulator YiaG
MLETMEEPGVPDPPFDEAMHELRKAYEKATAAIRSAPKADTAFTSATTLSDKLREWADSAAGLRAETVARIADEEKLSLAVLANRIGVSKARAGKLVENARKLNSQTAPRLKEE